MTKQDIKTAIILAAIECINRNGIEGISVRAIAKEAGVNIAAINYYFGAKENLLTIVMNRTMDELFVSNISETFDNPAMTQQQALQHYMTVMLYGMIRYSGLIKVHLHNFVTNEALAANFFLRLGSVKIKIANALKAYNPSITDDDSLIRASELFSIVAFIGFWPQSADGLGYNLSSYDDIGKYIKDCIDRCIR